MIFSFETWQITLFSISVGLASTLLILPFGIALAWLFARKAVAPQERRRNGGPPAAGHAAGVDGVNSAKNLRPAKPARAMALRTRGRNRVQLERRPHRDGGDVVSLACSFGANLFCRSQSAARADCRHARRFCAENFLRDHDPAGAYEESSPGRCWLFPARLGNSARPSCWRVTSRARRKRFRWRSIISSRSAKTPKPTSCSASPSRWRFGFVWCSEWLLTFEKRRPDMLLRCRIPLANFRTRYRRGFRRACNVDLRPVGLGQNHAARRHRRFETYSRGGD